MLLTATITPPAGVPDLARADPAQRLADYESALAFYLSLPGTAVDRVVLAENSGSDLAALEQVAARHGAGKQVELISFDGLDYPVQHGRGVGETRLIDTAVSRSRLLGALGEREPFWKVTGRLQVRNLAALVRSTPQGCDLYADFRRLPRQWVDTRVFACTASGFRRLFSSRIDLMRQDEVVAAGFSAPEERLFGELLGDRGARIVPRLRVEPRIFGTSGLGVDYGRPKRRAWSTVRGVSRKVVPGLWI